MSLYAYQQLEAQLQQEMDQGRLKPGQQLPSVRRLCQEQQVSKATVLHAYQRLEAAGRIEARPRSGYFVASHKGSSPPPPEPAREVASHPSPVNISEVFSDIMQRGAAFDLLPREQQAPRPPAGIQQLNRCLGRALRHQDGCTHQQYDEPAGYLPLRQQLALRYQREGCRVQADDFCITSGCQHALFLALKSCCQKGDLVAVESPGFYGVLQLLEQLELQVIEIPASPDSGMDLQRLEAASQRWPIKACVVSPNFSTPTGALMPEDQRHRLLKLAEEQDFVIIEDDIYRELAFAERPAPLKSLDTHNRVLLCGSFSKSLSRDLRLGWLLAGPQYQQLVQLKLVTQLASSRFVQQGLAHFLEEGHYDRHLRRYCQALQNNCQGWLEALEQQWPQQLGLSRPRGGLCLWAYWEAPINTLKLYQPALKAGLVLTPGPLFSARGRFTQALRLSFSQPCREQRYQALKTLQQLLMTQVATA
ncbi:PLP-dependent aminotransferase family protein [Marinospirillum perlucidum]|uniref:aminotransferase-like domain-containing protein n=1 Tax=Marinospirillum perlucidum TaxID=1982602 RepID=UPI000DF2EBD5|nr:PLP-dependent aminotransferase family protein [Marinospirillum perlucidum]